ncbi:hypothetical protein CZ809_00455 [Photobacterium piscicola]|uniref:Uncharacterized protein n=1 Tax=Photobacterium piscicola TaxID=1378299 RepID=A0A1T5HVV3_9GAMM|nr:hypothetical protein [Photobacterium piscicola]SKC30977.1 hypothetical protein CZ809_00455 [Photobacterium piscicola]
MSSNNSLLLDKINSFKKDIEKVEKKNHKKHITTRRLSLISLAGFLFSFTVLSLNQLYGDKGFLSNDCLLIQLLENGEIITDFMTTLIVITIPATLYLIVFSLYESTKNEPGNQNNVKFYLYLFVIFSLVITTFSSALFFMAMCSFGVTLLVLNYGANRYYGYTKAWVRNRAVRFHIDKMISEHELNVFGKARFMVEIEEQSLQKKFYALVDKNIDQQQTDIVGDHISVGDATVSWIKGLKK